jgi:UDP-glucose 4-epimerase
MKEQSDDPLTEFRATNVAATAHLARSAARHGVKRFVFVSSVGVHGRPLGRPFTEADAPAPDDLYAVSKLEAEMALREIASQLDMELVVVRPPLVYGPDCPGNFLRLLKLVASGVPLPFAKVSGLRSFISVSNLADFLAACSTDDRAAGKTFLISDNHDIALPALVKTLRKSMGIKVRLVPLSEDLLELGCSLIGKRRLYQKLCGELTVDPKYAMETLGWKPPTGLIDSLKCTGRAFIRK